MSKTRYVLSKRINRGGMAEIYLGKVIGADGFSKLVCIKRILPHYANEREFIEMFRDEAHICKRLQHANIVQVYSFEEVEGSYALIMEYINGADLRTILAACEREGTRLSAAMAVYTIAMAARGLHYAHTRIDDISGQPMGIIHRDISPQNILLGFDGEVKVTDFGIADAESKNTDTKPGIVKGKYAYMSPEQVSAKPIDPRTDVFALCVVLWETLAMRRLFSNENEMKTIKNVQNAKIPHKLSQLNPEVSPELQKIVEYGLQKDPKKRFDSAAALERTLLTYLNSHYPEFSPEHLSDFLKLLLSTRLETTMIEIKKILTQTDLEPEDNASSDPDQKIGADEKEMELSMDSISNNKNINIDFRSTQNQPRQTLAPQNRQFSTRYSNQTPQQRHRQHTNYANRPKQSNWLKYFFILALLISLSFGAHYQYKQMTSNFLRLIVAPARVKILLNNEPLFNNQYVQSPIKVQIPPGEHELLVYRAGYYARKYVIDGNNMNGTVSKNLALNLNPKFPGSNIRFEVYPPNKKVKININNGMFIEDTPFATPSLRLGRNHSVWIYPRHPLHLGAFECVFKATSNNPLKPAVMTIDFSTGSGRCSISD